jgi:hypothetical protein
MCFLPKVERFKLLTSNNYFFANCQASSGFLLFAKRADTISPEIPAFIQNLRWHQIC